MGRLLQAPQPQQLTPDSPRAWQFRPETQATWHYPGMTTAQFLAYYNDRAGILVTSRDPSGSIKLIKAVHREPGIRLGIAHVGDWPANGTRELEYPVTLQAFAGDWYQAAEIYCDRSLGQPWARTPLHVRRDVPGWLLDSPPHIMIRMQGELDEGPVTPNAQFLPYSKLVPLLEQISVRVDSPLLAVLMAWEKNGPWVYPECPSGGGDASVAVCRTVARWRERRTGSYSNGRAGWYRQAPERVRSGVLSKPWRAKCLPYRWKDGCGKERWDLSWRSS